jgi:glycosyltransferase involved in cell wall biosynthesis
MLAGTNSAMVDAELNLRGEREVTPTDPPISATVTTGVDADAGAFARTSRSALRLVEPLSSEQFRTLAIVIPCYNEQSTILEIIERVKALPIDKSIIVVDNCSTDGTRELLRTACGEERPVLPSDSLPPALAIEGQTLLSGDGFTVLLQPRNLHKAASVRIGIALADSEYVICQDADLEYDPEDILKLVSHAQKTGAVAVFGSRLTGSNPVDRGAFQMGRVGLTKLFRLLYRSQITDVATCYKLMKTDVAKALDTTTSGFDLDFEIPAKLRLLNHVIEDVPIRYFPRDRSMGKKIRWRDGLSASWTLLKLRFS